VGETVTPRGSSFGGGSSRPIVYNVNVNVGTWLGNEAGIRDLASRITAVQAERARFAGR
jgi:hypothetical protein